MSTIAVDNARPAAGGTSYSLTDGVPKSRVKFSGGGSTIDGSVNVSSLADNSTGNYNVNLTNLMADTTYSVAGAHQIPAVTSDQRVSQYATTTYNSLHTTSSGTADADPVSLLNMGDLA